MNNFSKIGFMLAALGSSVGLGHIWRFPYIAGTNGGGSFVLLYLFLALGIGIAMLIGEMLIGNKGRANAFKSYEKLDPSPRKRWRFAGLTLIGGPIILSFYAIVLGWVFYYLFFVSFSLPTDMEVSKANFDTLYSQNFIAQTMGLMLVLGISGWVIARGVKKGIELLNLILTPMLFLIFLGLLIYAMSMDSFPKALHFMLGFEWEQAKKALTLSIFIDSLGQVFFSLSLGIGIIITYAASSDSQQNLFKSALFIVLSGIVIAIMAGLMIFTFVYEYGGEVDGGAGLIFKTLPVMFAHLGFLGNIIAFLFLIAFSFAGITSAISLLEPSVMYIVEYYKISRFRATWSVVGVIFILGLMIVCSLCTPLASYLTFGNKSLMDIVEFLSANIIMTLGGLLAVIFVGWVIPKTTLYEFTSHFFSSYAFKIWYILMRYVAPFITIVILIAVSVKFFVGQDIASYLFQEEAL
ncbi:sodium-dependent transporter [Helicobacter sp. MIT 05-5293]|uniref:sodium-dependent transporter n=1 Tax=Helicobacter sp. MIT 05-5293 TaxID=1548149 RepID=UPI0010FCED44|nr:sodium-dependent transporter [Helicobacter sp. MIT 05-5293]TLD81624.1 sodium-dependent transporter [Helicobacter sp. MIT 05-5293]